MKEKIGFIGGGNMAKAICYGLCKKNVITFDQVWVSTYSVESLTSWKEKGVNTTQDNGKVVEESDIIFLSIKPFTLTSAMNGIKKTLTKPISDKLFISILAGTTLETLEKQLSFLPNSRIIRVMPNTPMMVGDGCTVFCPGKNVTENDIVNVKKILNLGICTQVPEHLITPVGALAGCGPAFVYTIIEALSDGGVKVGIPRDIATEFAAQTVLGAARMVLTTKKHTGQLKDDVCSPGGTTIAGIHELEKGGLRGIIMNAVETSAKRTLEIQQLTKNE